MKTVDSNLSDLDVAIEFSSNEALRTAVEAGAAAAVMSRLGAASSLLSDALVEVAMELAAPLHGAQAQEPLRDEVLDRHS
ncbi:hypothetical protein JOD31_002434 [Methylopila capsulata]|uniref:Uncharacterized protein n=1 Tax=Methylopila capsulata TaxID=61654 RepID=A0A9W6MSK0_9HYPH|nr:hypothetical protein [Methylopila capsulata]GLK56398.1 hypothetical protein GCM10008170_24170 [Methylopila capsulata]